MKFKKILALDTALNACSVSFWNEDSNAYVTDRRLMKRGHAEILMPQITDVMHKASVSLADVDLIVTTCGPGAFTGLRIGLSSARALGLATGAPVAGLTTTQVLARQCLESCADQAQDKTSLLVLVETKRKDFYYQLFDRQTGKPQCDAAAGNSADILQQIEQQHTIMIGDAIDRFRKEAGNAAPEGLDGFETPSPEVMIRMACDIAAQDDLAAYKAEPVYLRDADVSPSKKEQRILEGYKG
ncbi:MAG: tRNA (adenosine(37)-N6)-threonylcarbamoyltransferase complex dimerization subunit type 1 TsaB [Alphaproteobacteria bacterium]|nr:tRNA (adenosine(37)-N6)-threonylcarbamoyltransferase complex dimerization subunit type 1 TsaB [Alphaproteobacteria bacterium]MDP7222865.1 tRNA (adenosine(37)-N6)-threonylcarbamoyltransferase complex dimerization subunit type 1 TsaB [Alphaproteobacteria bacterium]